MKKMKEEEAKRRLREYFRSRRVEKRAQDGSFLTDKSGAVMVEEKPATVTGLALALGLSSREELFTLGDKKVKALIDRALLKIEEEAEEKLFSKDSFQGAKLFLSCNFKRWQGETEEMPASDLGIYADWAE